MDKPPPVPPKDHTYAARMELDRPKTAPGSGSKRKRHTHDDASYGIHNDHFGPADADDHTPNKRSRSNPRQSDASASEDATPANQRNVRRKKGSRNLSNLNLRHAAQQQAPAQSPIRESKFQEGSLTDKPSEKPPSVFTRLERTDSGNIVQVDQLMEDYHNGIPTPRESIDAAIEREKALIPQHVADITAEYANKDENKGFFQFGRHLAANFHPIALWNRIWNESKEELTRQNIEELERKRRVKAEAEAKYAEMKRNGQFALQPVNNIANGVRGSEDEIETPRDSAIAIESLQASFEQKRSVSTGSQLLPPKDDTTSRSGSEIPESSGKENRGLKSRLHLRKPSLSNLKNDLKRVRSDFSIGTAVSHRESSSSVSPVKTDFPNSALKKSESKHDLKKQQKLSKRVSDLEVKLQQARNELNEAIDNASPMPKLTGKYERFTPSGAIKRPKFVPGKLPSLPSERILMAEQMKTGVNGEDGEAAPRNAMELSLTEDLNENEEEHETIKARGSRKPIPRASSLFNHNNDNIEQHSSVDEEQLEDDTPKANHPSEQADDMDPNSINNLTDDGTNEAARPASYGALDAKLKALDANYKNTRKAAKPKKRKSGKADDEKAFKPGTESDDDAEWEDATPKKKRKSIGAKNSTSPPSKRATRAASGTKSCSPQSKKSKDVAAKNVLRKSDTTVTAANANGEEVVDEFSPDELAEEPTPARTSLDSQGRPLDPVYEEEEETVMVPVNDEPSKPTAKATPARYGRKLRSRSSSPNKRSKSLQPLGVEEQMMTRAADAAKKHPGRQGTRSMSPPPSREYVKTTTVEEETVSLVPGKGGVPNLPRGANGSFESLDELGEGGPAGVEVLRSQPGGKADDFQWPDDVF